ncbi:hydrolase [Tissierella carlieri]|uniref:Hydrolase n=1 Tax=Tissierella carlieri TaxID=689904 RepID=A0ABT1S9N8_9FIRM|nr:hydrolase [Tissierella carlieri]MCQ4922727.1 hydrolase [Tissierella carlieri]MDU5082271.1 hydrolase [Bacillota bacterium]
MARYALNRDNTALLIIDIQEKLASIMKYKEQIIDNTKILITAAKEMNMPIIVTEQYPKGIGPTIADIKEAVDNKEAFEKTNFSAYIGKIKEALDATGRKKVIITGMETHICVFQTARDLIENGYEVFIARDAVCSRTKENFLNGLELMKDVGAVISNTEAIVFDLLKIAGTPEFKVLSKLIK